MSAHDDARDSGEPSSQRSQSPERAGESSTPHTPATPTAIDTNGSRKREREISLEPSTPQAAIVPDAERGPLDKEREVRTPAKKNRVSGMLDTPAEEEEPTQVGGSPPHETKIRQISQGVEDLTWQNMQKASETEKDHPMESPSQSQPESAGDAHDAPEEPVRMKVAGGETVEVPPLLLQGENPPVTGEEAGEDEHAGDADPSERPPDAQPDTVAEATGSGEPDAPTTSSTASLVPSAPEPLPRLPVPKRQGSGSEEEPEKGAGVKRKMGDRSVSEQVVPGEHAAAALSGDDEASSTAKSAAKRQRDDDDADANPREPKRPTPPPEEEAKEKEETATAPKTAQKRQRDDPNEDANPREPKRPTPPPDEEKAGEKVKTNGFVKKIPGQTSGTSTPKMGGFMAYASTSSPFASVSGPNVFSAPKSPSPSPWATPSARPPSSASPFSSAISTPSSSQTTTTTATATPAHKRTGFEAFASTTSPFASAAKRPKSPPLGGSLFGRSSSPSRVTRPLGPAPVVSSNAFSAYAAGGAHGFSAAKRSSPVLGESEGKPLGGSSGSVLHAGAKSNGDKTEEAQEKQSFGERLRAQKDEEDKAAEDEAKLKLTEQEVLTGEEDEETVYQVRGKLYHLSEQNAWKERGTGTLRLNVRRDDGTGARLVMRKEAVYTVLLNAPLFRGMRCFLAQDPRYLRFSVLESGTATHYNLRVSNAKIAEELLDEINSHIPNE
ncbi:hypothetical protein CERSUDRAFT_112956 [Gelatoporia subvermispora B]|uniref:RanBD1 domain-containing protein n=1 Tax=Ceriporiopsis subvermispora (strain B) TaxID=914234 RepID=M2PRR9_CERS8|nr:hypothetical protein CERSUDRAFT_112956 [Gelatoporia subvermispora B]